MWYIVTIFFWNVEMKSWFLAVFFSWVKRQPTWLFQVWQILKHFAGTFHQAYKYLISENCNWCALQTYFYIWVWNFMVYWETKSWNLSKNIFLKTEWLRWHLDYDFLLLLHPTPLTSTITTIFLLEPILRNEW